LTSKTEQFYIRRIAELQEQLKQRDERIAALEKQVAELSELVAKLTDKVAKLSKNSSNSSKPPSSDIVKPPRKKKSNGSRNIGGQPGHTKHERTPFSTEEIDEFQTHTLDTCPDCGGKLEEVKNAGKVVQQVEIVKKPIHIEQHTGLCYWCEHCRKFHYAPMPAHIKKGQLIGPRLTAIVGYMKDFDVLVQFCIAHLNTRQAQNLANRFRKHGEAYFQFITTPGIEPTNNLAEQAIRFVVIDRRITQGTRSEKGRAWCQRIWTVLATCASQRRSAFDFMHQSIQAHFSDQPFPSLLGP